VPCHTLLTPSNVLFATSRTGTTPDAAGDVAGDVAAPGLHAGIDGERGDGEAGDGDAGDGDAGDGDAGDGHGDGGVRLVGFEHAGMNDVFHDLGSLSVEAGLDDQGEWALLLTYFGEVTPAHWARLQLMKIMSEFCTGMWAVAQRGVTTLDTDFAARADERLTRCERLVSRPEFTSWLDDAARWSA
jgi:thiamine kinase-like enzyme